MRMRLDQEQNACWFWLIFRELYCWSFVNFYAQQQTVGTHYLIDFAIWATTSFSSNNSDGEDYLNSWECRNLVQKFGTEERLPCNVRLKYYYASLWYKLFFLFDMYLNLTGSISDQSQQVLNANRLYLAAECCTCNSTDSFEEKTGKLFRSCTNLTLKICWLKYLCVSRSWVLVALVMFIALWS